MLTNFAHLDLCEWINNAKSTLFFQLLTNDMLLKVTKKYTLIFLNIGYIIQASVNKRQQMRFKEPSLLTNTKWK